MTDNKSQDRKKYITMKSIGDLRIENDRMRF